MSSSQLTGNGIKKIGLFLPPAMTEQSDFLQKPAPSAEASSSTSSGWGDRKKSDQQDVLREKKAGQGLIQTTVPVSGVTPQPAADTYRPISPSGPSSEKAMSPNVNTSSAWSAYGDWLNIESRAMLCQLQLQSLLFYSILFYDKMRAFRTRDVSDDRELCLCVRIRGLI